MKKLYLLLTAFAFAAKTFAQCTETPEPKVLLVGDSWAFFMNTEATINNVFKTWGHSNYKFVSNATLAENGAQTDDFQKADKEAEILNQLTLNPSIKVVHLSIGGNDFLGDWKKSYTQGHTDTLMDEVFVRLDSVMRFIKSCKPGIKIFYSGYVYPNFEETIHDLAPFESNHPFYGTWQGMEFPSFLEINNLLNDVSAKVEVKTANDPDLAFVKCTGLMQWTTGQNPALGVPPGGTYPAHSVTLPLGDPTYPSPKTTMRDYGLLKDCYHLSTQGYKDFVAYHTQKFYHKFLMDDLYLLSDAANTGSVSSQGNVSSSLFLGEASGEQFATVLSFNTTAMADTTLRKASIFIRRKALTGTTPVSGTLNIKVKNGNFGSSATVEAADFGATGDGSATPCLFGSYANNDDWARLDIPTSLFPYINHNGITQFVISAPNFTGGKEEFYDSSDPDFAPVLNTAYGTPTGIKEADLSKEFTVYPNPSTNMLTIGTGAESIKHIEVTNLLGQTVLLPHLMENNIDISALQPGMYILNVATKNGRASKRIVKE
jgi:hypothetical protein